ncbi:hypothetical protein RRG08_015512 [Elysia crispata]|uniref:Telomere length regulation protein conserved domain-containing protein n=1 Tax=Elysia crispata TaxID=231223 RepID=A0AAE1DWU0_9GAST|nr:hypothetical protein RRG08_015512 [Elysia crispata]
MVLKSEDKDNFSNINQGPRSIPPQHESVVNTSEANSVLDSDDDLEPFDLTNDRKVEKGKQPKFIRDCMEGLLCSSDEPDRIELCLSAAEALIRKKADGLEEIAVEFCKILLHMQDTHNLDNFQANRFGSLVALTVMCPSQVSEYLTSQFYESNYSIKQRMDMLETLTSAAHELSNVDKGLQSHSFQDSAAPNVSLVGSEALLWRKVIQGRIKDNARKFVHSRRQPEPVVTLNRFAPVAGKFFYPLMYGMGKRNMCLDLIEKDRLLLFQLLNTLAVVLYSCKNTHICTHMGRALLEFSWPIRLHQDSYLRQGVLIATTAVFLVVPTHSLMSDMFSNTIETKVWLEDVIERDPDTTCQKMAAEACFILQNNMNKEIISGP